MGLHPGSEAPCTAPAPANCVVLNGDLYVSDAEGVALRAKNDLITAYDNLLAERASCGPLVAVELAGKTYLPGVYCSPGTFGLSAGGILTLDAMGNPDAEFIFLTGAGGSTLITGAGSQVLFIGGAQACNVYWQVASSATIGVGTAFAGNILAMESIQLETGATLEGRALARTSAVTLDTNTITRADCATVVPPDGGGGGPGGGTPPGGGGPGGGQGGTTSPPTGDTTGGAAFTLTGAGLRSTDGALSTLSLTSSARDSGLAGQAGRAAQNFAVTGAAVRWQLFLAAMAIVLGGLMVLLSKPRRGARRRSLAGG
ncbi:MAG: ice-binding family protein [Actinomycetota bacterium]|nr:ice-binding family protein [Actinomycetota bacterium]